MVPSNVRVNRVPTRDEELSTPEIQVNAAGGTSHNDHELRHATEPTLSYNISEDVFHELSLEGKMRQGDTYVSFRVRRAPAL